MSCTQTMITCVVQLTVFQWATTTAWSFKHALLKGKCKKSSRVNLLFHCVCANSMKMHAGGQALMQAMMTCAEPLQRWPPPRPPTQLPGQTWLQCPTTLCHLATAPEKATCRQSMPLLLSSITTGIAAVTTCCSTPHYSMAHYSMTHYSMAHQRWHNIAYHSIAYHTILEHEMTS